MKCKILILLVFTFWFGLVYGADRKSPHGKNLKIDCTTCHKTDGWQQIKENGYNHNKSGFPLTGQHKMVGCRECHPTLKFEDAKSSCNSCHQDVHESTVDNDCKQCHNTSSWIVNNVRQIHQNKGFPLLGVHAAIDCDQCHSSASARRFDNVRTDCYGCHQRDYNYTTNPNHRQSGFGTDCTQCHKSDSRSWAGAGFDHNFFPLKGGHNIDCQSCHSQGYANTSTDCYSCHKTDYDRTTSPAHASAGFSTDCKTCHNINAWKPATFDHDKLYFPIYSGTHKGEWSNCTDCHTNPANYSQFSCTDCHEHNKADMDKEHRGKRDYVYNSVNCYSCHPRGKAD